MTQFGPIHPHDGGSKPMWLENETLVEDVDPGKPTHGERKMADDWLWDWMKAYRLPVDHWANAPLAAGMTPWAGGDEAPGDADPDGKVMFRDGRKEEYTAYYHWAHVDSAGDIIGYTPRRATVTEHAPDPMAALNERMLNLVKAVADSNDRLCYEAADILADRAKLTVDPDVLQARDLIADAVAYGAGGMSDPDRPTAKDFRSGKCDDGDLVTRALACYRLGKETAK